MSSVTFTNWDWRPAVLLRPEYKAFAVLAPGEDWTEVDEADVFLTAAVLPERRWREVFEAEFGPLDISGFSQSAPASREAAE